MKNQVSENEKSSLRLMCDSKITLKYPKFIKISVKFNQGEIQVCNLK